MEMKKAKRIIGMVLLIVGGFLTVANLIALWAVLTVRDVDYRLGSAVMVLIFILFSVGVFTLGWRLRHPRNKASDPAQERPAPAKPVYDPPKPRKLTAEEKQRQAEEKAQRQRLWREQAEAMKKNMVQHTKEILEQDIRGTARIVIPYNPQVDMLIPEWLRSAS